MNDCIKKTLIFFFGILFIILIIELDFFNNSNKDLNKLLNTKNNINADNQKIINKKLAINNNINEQIELARNDALNEIESFENNETTRNNKSKNIESLIEDLNEKVEGGDLSSQFIENCKIILLYKLDCPHSQLFIPTWNLLKSNLPEKYTVEEIECSQDMSKCIEYGISGVPAIYIEVEKYNIGTNETENKNHIINGNMEYIDLIENLKSKGIKVKDIEIENFVDYISAAQDQNNQFNKNRDPDCPAMSFNMPEKGIYCVDSLDKQRRIRGCSNGSAGNREGLTEFDAAYNSFGTYLTSLPSPTPSNMSKCIREHKDTVRQFGLCKPRELLKKSQYSTDIKKKKAKTKFLNEDYSANSKISNAISFACSI